MRAATNSSVFLQRRPSLRERTLGVFSSEWLLQPLTRILAFVVIAPYLAWVAYFEMMHPLSDRMFGFHVYLPGIPVLLLLALLWRFRRFIVASKTVDLVRSANLAIDPAEKLHYLSKLQQNLLKTAIGGELAARRASSLPTKQPVYWTLLVRRPDDDLGIFDDALKSAIQKLGNVVSKTAPQDDLPQIFEIAQFDRLEDLDFKLLYRTHTGIHFAIELLIAIVTVCPLLYPMVIYPLSAYLSNQGL